MRKPNCGDLLRAWLLAEQRSISGDGKWIPYTKDQIHPNLLFIDFDQAAKIAIDPKNYEIFFSLGPKEKDFLWQLIIKVGYVKERVFPFIDPGIRPLLDRLYDIGMISMSDSCSGHPNDGFIYPHALGLVFRKPTVGIKLIDTFRRLCEERQVPCSIEGYGPLPYQGMCGPQLPYDVCLHQVLPISIYCEPCSDIKQAYQFWICLGDAIVENQLDNKGPFIPDPELFAKKSGYDEKYITAAYEAVIRGPLVTPTR